MLKRKDSKKWAYRLAALTLGVATSFVVGCGKANNDGAGGSGGVAPGYVNNNLGQGYQGCPAGQVYFGNGCMSPTDIMNSCYGYGKQRISDGSQTLCMSQRWSTVYMNNYWNQGYQFSLTRTNPSGGIFLGNLARGARVSIDADGYWGPVSVDRSSSRFLGIPISSWSYSCQKISPDGVKEDSNTTTNYDGLPAGLTASDGRQTRFVGSYGEFVTSEGGALRVGINAPTQNIGSGCLSMAVSYTVTECVDASGNGVVCPAGVAGF